MSLFHLHMRKAQAVGGVVLYWFVAALVTYFSWPNLWGDALRRFWQRLIVSADFESHILLFEEIHRSSTDLPWYFLPKLLALQLTEPVLLLGLLGLTLAGLAAWQKKVSRPDLAVLLAWFFLPCGAQVILRTPIYGNFRHLLFALPPLFLLSGYGLVRGIGALRWPGLRGMLLAAVLLPGLVGIMQLHPLEVRVLQ